MTSSASAPSGWSASSLSSARHPQWLCETCGQHVHLKRRDSKTAPHNVKQTNGSWVPCPNR